MILDGKKLADRMRPSLKRTVSACLKKGIRPGLGIILAGQDQASEVYVASKCQMAQSLGMKTRSMRLSGKPSEKDVLSALRTMNDDPEIHGIIVQIPLPKNISFAHIQNAIDQRKDIDCLHPANISLLADGKPFFVPPTAQSVIALIQESGISLRGSHCAIVGRGFFARQIAALCTLYEAHTTIIRSRAPHAKELMKIADVLISVVGKPEYITAASVKKGAVVIDVGISKIGTRIVGDVDFSSVIKKAHAISPVPGGVGPLTVMYLMRNVIYAAKMSLR